MSADIQNYYQKLKDDIEQALDLCAKPEIQSEFGIRIEDFRKDLQDLQNMSLAEICSLSVDEYAYFRGPNLHDDVYDKGRSLLNLAFSILSQIAGIKYANES